ncbi:MAG: hypothetical protein V4693_13740 [Pseudomonadota bacterium]
MKKLTLIGALLLAAGCNGEVKIEVPRQPPPASDAFYSLVLAQIAVSPEDSDGGSVDNLTATAPEDSEPLLP